MPPPSPQEVYEAFIWWEGCNYHLLMGWPVGIRLFPSQHLRLCSVSHSRPQMALNHPPSPEEEKGRKNGGIWVLPPLASSLSPPMSPRPPSRVQLFTESELFPLEAGAVIYQQAALHWAPC